MRVHVIQTGRLVGNKTVMSNRDQHGPNDAGERAIPQRAMSVPRPFIEAREEIEPQMRALGLAPEDIRRVMITHLDWDHTGGWGHFPNAARARGD